MTQFPDTEVYVICYSWGSSGSFIASLVYDLVYEPTNISFSENGNSHDRADACRENWNVDTTIGDLNIPDFSYTAPKDPALPLIIYQHVFPNFDEIFKKFSKAKVIVITISEKDVPIVRFNAFNKVYKTLNKTSPHIESIIRVNSDYLNIELDNLKNVFILPFHDICNNKNRVLSMLHHVTGRSITGNISNTYDTYINLQKKLYG